MLAPSDCPQGIQPGPYPKHATHAFLSRPRSLVADARVWATSPLGVAVRCVFCGLRVLFFSPPPGYVALWDSKTPHRLTSERVSCGLEASPPSWLPPQDRFLSLILLSFCLLYFVLPPFEEHGLPFWVLGVFRQHSQVVLLKLLSIPMIFWWICGRESDLPILFLCHLGTVLCLYFLIHCLGCS